LAPSARVEVKLNQPSQNWRGHGYLDANEGVEPIEVPFKEWDWSRSLLVDGSVAVMYDVQYKEGADKLLALKFHPDGQITSFEAPSRIAMKKTAWWLARRMRSESSVSVAAQLEDTPFYQRAILESQLLGESVTSFHETLNVPRLVSPVVQGMLPWRMPRRP
jgi:carotenoid 1,2-hydratase